MRLAALEAVLERIAMKSPDGGDWVSGPEGGADGWDNLATIVSPVVTGCDLKPTLTRFGGARYILAGSFARGSDTPALSAGFRY